MINTPKLKTPKTELTVPMINQIEEWAQDEISYTFSEPYVFTNKGSVVHSVHCTLFTSKIARILLEDNIGRRIGNVLILLESNHDEPEYITSRWIPILRAMWNGLNTKQCNG
jgi:hypothetical protein